MASPMATPTFWVRIHPDVAQKFADTAQKHETIENSIQPPGSIERLAEQHQKYEDGSYAKTLSIEPYIFKDISRGVEDIKQLEMEAKSGKADSLAKTESTMEEVGRIKSEFEALQLDNVATALSEKKENACNIVKVAAAKLEEIVLPEKKLGCDAVLKSEFDAATLDAAEDGKKKVLYNQVKEKRIGQRREATIEGARELCNGDWHTQVANAVNFRKQILDFTQQADLLKQGACRASEAKGDAASIVTGINETLKTVEQQHEDCKAQKNEVNKKLQKKRTALAKALQQLLDADLDYTNTYCEHEALRMQTENLKQCISRTEEHKTVAEAAAQAALDACDEWQNAAREGEQQLRERISAQVDVCQSSIMVPTQAAALNIQLASKIVTSASREIEVEISSIQKDQEERNRQHSKLKDEMVAEEPERDIDEIEFDLDKLMDVQTALGESLGKSNEMKTRLQAELERTTESFKTLKDFFGTDPRLANFFEASDVEKKASQGAFELANESYKDYKLFKKGAIVQRPAAAANAGALVAMDANMKAWIEQMIDQKAEEKANAKVEQLRADILFRRQAGSSASSDAGDWMQVSAAAEASDAESNK